MALLLCVFCAVLLGWCRFGSLRNFAGIEIRFIWLPAASMLIEFAALPLSLLLPVAPSLWMPILVLISYALLFIFLFGNLHLRGTVLMASGSAANLLVIMLNSFKMPVSALPPGGMTPYQSLRYVLISDSTRLSVLADILWIPFPPIRGYASLGDLGLALGAALVVLSIMRPKKGLLKPAL